MPNPFLWRSPMASAAQDPRIPAILPPLPPVPRPQTPHRPLSNGHPSMRSLTLTQSTLLLPRLLLLLLLLLLPAVKCQFAPHPLPVPPTLPHHPLIPRILFRLLAWLRPLMFLRRPPQMQPCLLLSPPPPFPHPQPLLHSIFFQFF